MPFSFCFHASLLLAEMVCGTPSSRWSQLSIITPYFPTAPLYPCPRLSTHAPQQLISPRLPSLCIQVGPRSAPTHSRAHALSMDGYDTIGWWAHVVVFSGVDCPTALSPPLSSSFRFFPRTSSKECGRVLRCIYTTPFCAHCVPRIH